MAANAAGGMVTSASMMENRAAYNRHAIRHAAALAAGYLALALEGDAQLQRIAQLQAIISKHNVAYADARNENEKLCVALERCVRFYRTDKDRLPFAIENAAAALGAEGAPR